MSTEEHYYGDLSNDINLHTGGISFETEIFDHVGRLKTFYPKLVVKSRALVHKLPELMGLVGEIISMTSFNDKKRLKEIISQTRSRMEMLILDNGHMLAAYRLASYYSPSGKYKELSSGIGFYKFISDLDKNFDEKANDIICNLQKASEIIFSCENLIISSTVSETNYPEFVSSLSSLFDYLPCYEVVASNYCLNCFAENEGLLIPSEVQYVAKGFNFIQLGYPYSGSLRVLNTILSLNYLWEKIRIQGGAYGGFAKIDRTGDMVFLSYRDPNLKETLEAYNDMPEYIKGFSASDREITKFIIGTIGQIDTPLTPALKGEIATANYFRGISQDDLQRERDEILRTTVADINNLYPLVDSVIKQPYFCVLGNEGIITENAELFTKLTSVFE
jgi:Zn-dependent M16 (insulinase) family peptidase